MAVETLVLKDMGISHCHPYLTKDGKSHLLVGSVIAPEKAYCWCKTRTLNSKEYSSILAFLQSGRDQDLAVGT